MDLEAKKEKRQKRQPLCQSQRCLLGMGILLVLCIAAAIVIALLAPSVRMRKPPNMKWWQTSVVYQIYPRSFKDSNGDGIGDLKGIISKLEHFEYLNVKAIWISPFYPSPMKDFGYDVSNYMDIHPDYGTLNDFDELVKRAGEKGIKIIIDFVPNHTSDEHEWFKKSRVFSEDKRDYYVWDRGLKLQNNSRVPPNNWLSVFGYSAWQFDTDEFYYHAYLKEQPDLNYRNPKVVEEMKNVLRFWLKRGVYGFRVDAVSHLFESEDRSQNEARSNTPGLRSFQYDYLRHEHTENLPGIKDIVTGWRSVLEEFSIDNEPKFMLTESHITSQEERNKWYTYGADMPFNFALAEALSNTCGGTCIHDVVKEEYDGLPEGAWPNFVLANHDKPRVTTTKGHEFVNALNMLLLTLRGTPTTYYGEEIGMLDTWVSYKDSVDPRGCIYNESEYLKYSRDPERGPMQWDDSFQAGFTNASKPWLPVQKDYSTINVQAQRNSSDTTSIKVYRKLALLREEPAFSYGKMLFGKFDENVFSYVRRAEGFPAYLVVINFGNSPSTADYSGEPVSATQGKIVVTTANFNSIDYSINSTKTLSALTLESAQGLVIEL